MQSTQADAGVNRGPSVFAPRPKPRRESVPLERLTFSADNQMRDLPGGALYDEAAVVGYVEALESGAVFPPLEAVEEQRKGRQPVYWVFAGFTRGEAYRRWGKANSVEVLVYPGTAADAQFYALSENRTHGQRSTHGDKLKAVYALLDTPPLLLRAKNAVDTGRTLDATIAGACGVSKSTVHDALRARNLSINGRQIIPRQSPQSSADASYPVPGKSQTVATTTPVQASAPVPLVDVIDQRYTVPSDFDPATIPNPERARKAKEARIRAAGANPDPCPEPERVLRAATVRFEARLQEYCTGNRWKKLQDALRRHGIESEVHSEVEPAFPGQPVHERQTLRVPLVYDLLAALEEVFQ